MSFRIVLQSIQEEDLIDVVDISGNFISPEVRELRRAAPPFSRGLIMAGQLEFDVERNFVSSGDRPHDRSELLKNVLYWDKLVTPENGFIGHDDHPDIAFLRDCGVFESPRFPSNGAAASIVANSFRDCFITLEAKNPGSWVMAGDPSQLQFSELSFQEGRGALFQLTNAIPALAEDVPLAEALEFKFWRYDELIELRFQLDSFFDNWLNSADRDHSLKVSTKRIEIACRDAIQVSKESKLPFNLMSWTTRYSLGGLSSYALIDILKDGFQPQTELESVVALTGSLATTLIDWSPSGAPKLSTNSSRPFSYVGNVTKELNKF